MQTQYIEKGITQNTNYSAWFWLPDDLYACGVNVPDIDAGDVHLELTLDGGSNWVPVCELGSDAVLVSSGSDPGYADFTHLVRAVKCNSKTFFRFTAATQTTANVVFGIFVTHGKRP